MKSILKKGYSSITLSPDNIPGKTPRRVKLKEQ